MAISASPRDDDSQDDTLVSPVSTTSNGFRDRRNSSARSLRDQYNPVISDVLEVPEPYQLPSPELSPSPRSESPSLISEKLLVESTGRNGLSNGHSRSPSFEHISHERDDSGLNGNLSPKPISKRLPSLELHDIPEERPRHSRKPSMSKSPVDGEEWPRHSRKSSMSKSPLDDKVLKLSPFEIEELTTAPESLPLPLSARLTMLEPAPNGLPIGNSGEGSRSGQSIESSRERVPSPRGRRPAVTNRGYSTPIASRQDPLWPQKSNRAPSVKDSATSRNLRAISDVDGRRRSESRPEPLDLNSEKPSSARPHSKSVPEPTPDRQSSPLAQDLPLPPMSIPMYLQLELASSRPSPLYIHRSSANEYPYESSRIKFERLLNFLLLPPQLEQALIFGSLACLDAWLHTFTILPLRFIKALLILAQWWGMVIVREARFIAGFIYHGSGGSGTDSVAEEIALTALQRQGVRHGQADRQYRQRLHISFQALQMLNTQQQRMLRDYELNFNANRGRNGGANTNEESRNLLRYQFTTKQIYFKDCIRGQSLVKLYMIWNVIEVADRLLAALGQDIFECLFADETIERGPDGRSRVLRPFGMFLLALIYNIVHAVTLFYQVISLNVAVNSYSNALISLLMSNMFVEVKSTVFKKFEKDNIFQMTCADIVERFQLWLMLIIIGLRNVVEVGGLSITSSASSTAEAVRNTTMHTRSGSTLPASFTILPNWTGEVLSPFLLVLGSEMLVDWMKHAYIGKFNNIKPALYQKFLDVLAKDYYTNAFVNQNLTKRLGLPVIPLSCLFIRSSFQTYHMFLATHLPPPIPSSATSLALEGASPSPETTAALAHFDAIIRSALGRSTFGTGFTASSSAVPKSWFNINIISSDDLIAVVTMCIFFLCAFLVLLACKLVLGMVLLSYARGRYGSMKKREHLSLDTKGKRLGGLGVVEVDDDKKRWIYEDDPEGQKMQRERERKAAMKAKETEKGGGGAGSGIDFGRVARYDMVAKRIW